MDRLQAARIVRDTFQHSFDRERFTRFISNLLNHLEDKPFRNQGNLIPDAFERHISKLERIGKYSDSEHAIDVLIVTLKKGASVERARSMQRNFIARYLNGSRGGNLKDAALVAFVSPDSPDWRFSLIKMDYRIEHGETGRMKVKDEFTPARRWSFLVGQNEDSHTAQSRLAPIIADDAHDPSLRELEEAFNIERVTKEFFEEYRGLFLWVKEELDRLILSDAAIKSDFETKRISTVDFAKKLLGQIVFLYFLQKKGWFGVTRDGAWGSGSRHFLRELFEKRHGQYRNFFNDILEPLFYEALRLDRSHDDDYYSKLNCRIPFLNGGLFDPINGYDWVHKDILLPDELFSNTTVTASGDKGTGILDVFDRYNFTVKEDEPLEKEVAIDPEMLGKIFEKLGAITPDKFDDWASAVRSGNKTKENEANKKLGVYYTPREIVHYMCRQSLIHHLSRELKPAHVYQELGANQAELFGNEVRTGQLKLMHEKGNGSLTRVDIETLVHLGERVTENEAQVISRGKETDTYYHRLPDGIRTNAAFIDENLANIKVLDPAIGSGAFPVGMMTEIVKLRTALSTFIGGERTAYEFKRHCIQSSLYGVDIDPGAVEIAKLRLWLSLVVDEDDIRQIKPLPNLDYKIVCGNSLGCVQRDVLNDRLFAELDSLKTRFFDETSPGRKKEEKARIDELIAKLTHNDRHFDYSIYFNEVFDHARGFDIVIANPPYGVSLPKALKKEFKTYSSRGESYVLFIERGLSLLKFGGHLAYIVPDTYLNLSFASPLRAHILKSSKIKEIVILPARVFENATVDTTLLSVEKVPVIPTFHKTEARIKTFTKQNRVFDMSAPTREVLISTLHWYKQGTFNVQSDPDTLAIIRRLDQSFEKVADIAEMFSGIKVYEVGKGEPPQNEEIRAAKPFTSTVKMHEGFLPFFDGKHVGRYALLWHNNNWVHYGPWLAAPRNPDNFLGEKILIRKIVAETLISTYVSDTSYCNTLLHVLKLKPNTALSYHYLLGVLNSRFIGWYFRAKFQISPEDTFPQIMIRDILRFPIPKPSREDQAPIISLVQQILANPDSLTVSHLEAEIDRLVYGLYGLDQTETVIIEG